MTSQNSKTRVLLLIEDNPGDAELFRDMMEQTESAEYQILQVPRLSAAVDMLRSTEIDVIVLDLRLPDCTGVESVRRVRATAEDVPIVVLTGSDDEQLATACLDAGAQDYLAKAEARAHNLKRAIGYAITRQREAQVRDLRRAIDQYRALSSSSQATTVTAALAGSGAIALRAPDTFRHIADQYFALLQPYLAREQDRVSAPRHVLEAITTQIGDANGGPRDLLDAHLSALDRALAIKDDAHSRSLVFEGRLLALEMMGLLVDYYRVGYRRRFIEGIAS